MLIAIDSNRNRIHIRNAAIRQEYFCPYCDYPVIMKKGCVRMPHFAHRSGSKCLDSWYAEYDMSDWHIEWQSCYPEANQEIPCQLGEIRHRADIMVDRTVIEFQHSPLSANNFSKRNHFYHDLGYKVIWLFDLIEQFENDQISVSEDKEGILHLSWTRPRTTFQDSDILSSQIEIFFQLNADGEHCLVRVDDVSTSGIEIFSSNRWYSKTAFLEYTGLSDGKCLPPYHEDIDVNETYHRFCTQYHITLNPQQERAVQAINGANLILAVPGSGKTTVLVVRIGYMVLCRGINPKEILCITYTNAAANDMKSRFANIFGQQLAENIQFKTINALCAGIIRVYEKAHNRKAYSLIEDKDRRGLLQSIYQKITDKYPTENDLIEAETAITFIKNMMITKPDIIKSIDNETPDILSFYCYYTQQLLNMNAMDYDDQMRYALRILKEYPDILFLFQNRCRYLCVDEAQDTSKLQHTIIQMLAGKYNNIFMVGDEDQSIYSFRAAYPQALLNFRNDYQNPFILYLEKNYRSTLEIVDAAQSFIAQNQNRHPKLMTADHGHGDPITRIIVKTRIEQYQYLVDVLKKEHSEIAVLYRNNECAVPLLDLLLRNNIPYYTRKNRMLFFTSGFVKDMVFFLRFVISPFDIEAFMNIYFKCNHGFNKKTAQFACNRSRKEKIPITEALIKNLSKYWKWKNKAERFSQMIQKARSLSTAKAIQFIYDSMYRRYAAKNDMDSKKLDILIALALSEPDIGNFLKRMEALPSLIDAKSHRSKQAVVLSTVHSGKGREFDTVYIMDAFDGYLPECDPNQLENDSQMADKYQEERRIFYVAITRAKNKLFIFDIASFTSSFVRELPTVPYRLHQDVAPSSDHAPFSIISANAPKNSMDINPLIGYALNNNSVVNNSFQTGQPQSQEESMHPTQYEIGYDEVKSLFVQQTSIIRDHFNHRWVKCEKCGTIKQEHEFVTYGGSNHLNLGICKSCGM